MTAADLNKHAREHWAIENKKHYIRDTVYREDENQSWKGSGPQALASFRNFATSLFSMKEVKNIKEATEIVHMDRHLAFNYMKCMIAYGELPVNGPAGGLPPGRFLIYPSGRVARVADVFFVRLVVRGDGGASDGSGSASAAAAWSWVSCSVRRWWSARAVSRSASARSARTRSASRVSSRAVMRASVAAVSWLSACR
jgi:hypothetical protein